MSRIHGLLRLIHERANWGACHHSRVEAAWSGEGGTKVDPTEEQDK